MNFLQAFGGIFSLIIVAGIGYWLSRKGYVENSLRVSLPKFITNICLPPFLAYTILTSFPRKDLDFLLPAVGTPLAIIASMFTGAYILATILKINRHRFGLFCAAISNSNTIFIGIPVNSALFGEQSVPYVLFYYFAATLFFWTVGNYFISRDLQAGEGIQERLKIRWNQIISPSIIGLSIGLILLYGKIELPGSLLSAAQMIGQLTTPLALIYIGIVLEKIGLKNLVFTRDITIALIGRLVICPLTALMIVPFFHLPALMGKVYIMQSSLPVLMQVSILSGYYNTDPDFGAIIVTLSTLLCVISIPVWMILI